MNDDEDRNDEDQPPTPEELSQAAALARALDERSGGPAAAPVNAATITPAPDDLLAAAALLHHAAPARQASLAGQTRDHLDAAAARVLPAVDARRPRRRWRWLAPLTLAPMAVAAVALFTLRLSSAPHLSSTPPSAAPLPGPSAALLRAQADATHGGPALAELDRQMRSYRSAFYRTLVARAGGAR